jgi:hypothetical protein
VESFDDLKNGTFEDLFQYGRANLTVKDKKQFDKNIQKQKKKMEENKLDRVLRQSQ